jgi:type IV pilus assembly protein PilX
MTRPATASTTRQRGISLLVVMVVVLLSCLLALWGFRTALVNETYVGNDVDYQRAFEAAQAMLQDAELDIRGERADGSSCVADANRASVCRMGTTLAFIEETPQLTGLLARLASDAPESRCVNAICQKRTGVQDFWNVKADWDRMVAAPPAGAASAAARYGDYTGALPPSDSQAKPNPLLTERAADQGAWYWIEVMPYDDSPTGLLPDRNKLELNLNPFVVYRITAVATGRRAFSRESGKMEYTKVVLQSTYARQKLKN